MAFYLPLAYPGAKTLLSRTLAKYLILQRRGRWDFESMTCTFARLCSISQPGGVCARRQVRTLCGVHG